MDFDAEYVLESAGILMTIFGQNTVPVEGTLVSFDISDHGDYRLVSMTGSAPHVNFNVNLGGTFLPRYAKLVQDALNP